MYFQNRNDRLENISINDRLENISIIKKFFNAVNRKTIHNVAEQGNPEINS